MSALSQPHDSTPVRPIRVCHIIATTELLYWPVNQLSRLRDDYGYEVAAIVSGPEGALVDRLREAGIPCHVADLDFPMVPPLPDAIRKTVALAELLRRERFDVVQTATWHAMLLGRVAAWLADVPVRLTMTIGPYYVDGPIHRWIDGDTSWMESFVIGCCQYIVDSYRKLGIGKHRLELVYYGPDESRFTPETTVPSNIREQYGWPSDTPLIVHVSWFYPRLPVTRWAPKHLRGKGFKGHEQLIRSAPMILREFPNARILLVGQAFPWGGEHFQDEMKALVQELGLEQRVIFTGFLPTVNDVLMAADVAVQPSTCEGCGGTFESLLMEAPTVGSRTGGIPDMVIDGKTGVLVTPDDPTDLARGICDLLRDPARARALGKAGRQHVLRTATLSKTAADLDRLYRQWLFKGGRRKMGHRPWVTRLRYPGMVLTWLYINTRLERIEFGLIRKWMAGWRPWHEIYTPHVRQAAASAATASLHARDAVSASTLPVRLFASSWIGRFRRGEVRMNKPTLRLLALDLIAMQPPKLRTFMYESIARYRGATRDRG